VFKHPQISHLPAGFVWGLWVESRTKLPTPAPPSQATAAEAWEKAWQKEHNHEKTHKEHGNTDLHNRVFLTPMCQNASRFVIFSMTNFFIRRRKV